MGTNSDDNTSKLESKLEKIEQKIDKVIEHVSRIDVTLGKQQVSLDYHILRSDNLEAMVLPLKKDKDMRMGAMKLVGLAGVVAAIAEGIFTVLEYFKK